MTNATNKTAKELLERADEWLSEHPLSCNQITRPLVCNMRDYIFSISTSSQADADITPTLNPDMPAQELRLYMGELTASEMRVARAAIRWANNYPRQTNKSQTDTTYQEMLRKCTNIMQDIREHNLGWHDDYNQYLDEALEALKAAEPKGDL